MEIGLEQGGNQREQHAADGAHGEAEQLIHDGVAGAQRGAHDAGKEAAQQKLALHPHVEDVRLEGDGDGKPGQNQG